MSNLSYESLVQYVAARFAHGEHAARRVAENFERNLGLDAGKLLSAARLEAKKPAPGKPGKRKG